MPLSNLAGKRRWQRGMRSVQVRVGRWLASATYTQKWLVLGTVVGIIAGLGAVVFYEALRLATYVFLQVLAGYKVPLPASEGGAVASTMMLGMMPWPWMDRPLGV